jgi:MOSC domain-containing protein YiiM
MNSEIKLLHLYISPGHNFFGRHGQRPGDSPVMEVDELACTAGRGIEGDRFFDYKENYNGQITFFAEEVYLALRQRFRIRDKEPAVFRRNVITEGVDLNSLIGKEFEIQGVRFFGTEHCKPCYWMDRAFHPGAEAALDGQGGLRAKILTTGRLRRTADFEPLIFAASKKIGSAE